MDILKEKFDEIYLTNIVKEYVGDNKESFTNCGQCNYNDINNTDNFISFCCYCYSHLCKDCNRTLMRNCDYLCDNCITEKEPFMGNCDKCKKIVCKVCNLKYTRGLNMIGRILCMKCIGKLEE